MCNMLFIKFSITAKINLATECCIRYNSDQGAIWNTFSFDPNGRGNGRNLIRVF